jgi:hypothetical protein
MTYDQAELHARGVAPALHTWIPRDPGVRILAGVTDFCSDCGQIFYVDEGHSCSPRRAAS